MFSWQNKTTVKYYHWCKTPFPLYNDILYLVDGIVAMGAMAFHAGNPPAATATAATDAALAHHDKDSLNGISPSISPSDDDNADNGDDEATQVCKYCNNTNYYF
jgi:hypothetical protein